MEIMVYTREASAPTERAIKRRIGFRRFGHANGTFIGSCPCHHVDWGDCPRVTDTQIWESIQEGWLRQGWYKGRPFYK